MTKARYNWKENNVLARCPDCAAITSFDDKGFSNTKMGISIADRWTTFEGKTYSRILWHAVRCSVCSRGAIAKILDNDNSQAAVLADFIPTAVENAAIPPSVPADIQKEFREAELDAANGAYRSGSALLRSVLEKTLKRNGYDEIEYRDEKGVIKKSSSLLRRVDAASEDGILTETRKKRAHENIRVLATTFFTTSGVKLCQKSLTRRVSIPSAFLKISMTIALPLRLG